jgi:hypothetical protein
MGDWLMRRGHSSGHVATHADHSGSPSTQGDGNCRPGEAYTGSGPDEAGVMMATCEERGVVAAVR